MKEKIAIVLGSKADQKELEGGLRILKGLKVGYRLEVISAHRNPEKLRSFCKKIENEGVEVVIACAGKAAALPGFIASYVDLPVIGVALEGGILSGLDALLSIVSTPKGLGLACSGVGKSAFINGIIFSLEVLSLKNREYRLALQKIKKKFR